MIGEVLDPEKLNLVGFCTVSKVNCFEDRRDNHGSLAELIEYFSDGV